MRKHIQLPAEIVKQSSSISRLAKRKIQALSTTLLGNYLHRTCERLLFNASDKVEASSLSLVKIDSQLLGILSDLYWHVFSSSPSIGCDINRHPSS
jgi:hypothetical protein